MHPAVQPECMNQNKPRVARIFHFLTSPITIKENPLITVPVFSETAEPICKVGILIESSWHGPSPWKSESIGTVFLGENVIQIAKMQSSVATNLHYLSILFYNKSQKWKILATLGLFWCMQSGYIAGCIQKSVDSSLCLIGLIVFLRSLMVLLKQKALFCGHLVQFDKFLGS